MKKHSKNYHFVLVTAVLLNSCCWTDDSTVPPGYPFNGHAIELETFKRGLFKRNLDPMTYSYVMRSRNFNIDIIKDSNDCNKFFRQLDPDFVSDIDFNLYNITFLTGTVKQVYTYEFQKRILIDHHEKTYTIELRGYTKTCNSGMNSNYNDYTFEELMIIPKVPLGYTYSVKKFSPVN